MAEISGIYLNQSNIKQINQLFSSNLLFPSVKLPGFLTAESYGKIRRQVIASKLKKINHPILYSYSTSKLPSELGGLFKSRVFLSFISQITKKKAARLKPQLQIFSWQDYTILNDEAVQKPGTDIVFDLTENWNEDAGGAIVYTDTINEPYVLSASPNTLFIANRGKGMQRFVQYLNHYSKNKKRIFLIATF